MKRAEIWTVAGGPDYAGKPRPAVILQDDAFESTASITLCPLTTHLVDAPLIRLAVDPTRQNGLAVVSHVMVDKITTVAKSKLQKRIGKLAEEDMIRLPGGSGVPRAGWTSGVKELKNLHRTYRREYARLVEAVSQAVDRADPIGLLAMGCPADEYAPEVVVAFRSAVGARVVARRTHRISAALCHLALSSDAGCAPVTIQLRKSSRTASHTIRPVFSITSSRGDFTFELGPAQRAF